ncbi:hypothetical protein Ancab_005667 [Ancistrocladus abbreviatus]
MGWCYEMPLIVGPLSLNGREYTIPMATTKGCLVSELEDNGIEMNQENGALLQMSDKSAHLDRTSVVDDNPKSLSANDERAIAKLSEAEDEKSESNVSQEKTLKKPDKILPCPRCNSMDTKFCYYNNYNVNQPRHFCKCCQRYWTAGGSMRNVPVGAGRRKSKNSASLYRHVTVSDTLQNARLDTPNGTLYPALKANGTVLTFGSDTPLCESMASILIAEKTMRNCTQNELQKPGELKITIPLGGQENQKSVSSDGASKSGLKELETENCHVFPLPGQCFPGAPWPYPWNAAPWNPHVPMPAFCPNGYSMPFYPAFWGCSLPGTWNLPWVCQPCHPNHTMPSSCPNSPTLGKHSREGNAINSSISVEDEEVKENNTQKCLWIPKTLRIDDPEEAVKSSIWTTLGIKNNKADSLGGHGLFKGLQPSSDEKHHLVETSTVLRANPAALSRSQSFHETS